MSGDAMSREQQSFIDKVYQFVSDATNMTKDEAEDFSFRVWQMRGFLRTALTPWISVKDRLPEVCKHVLTYDGDDIREGYLTKQ